MRLAEQCMTQRDGRKYCIRSLKEQDAESILDYRKRVSGETPYLANEPEEIDTKVEEERFFIRYSEQSEKILLLGAFLEEQLVGMISLAPVSEKRKMCHRGGIGISVLWANWGQGIGRSLFQTVLSLAKQCGYTQLEMECVAENKRALSLYDSLGFVSYGTRPGGVRLSDGRMLEEVLLWKSVE